MAPEPGSLECSNGVGDMRDVDVKRTVHVIKGGNEPTCIFRDGTNASGKDRPDGIDAVVCRARDLVFARISGHFELRGQGKERLHGENAVESLRKPFLRGRVESVLVDVGSCDAAVVEQRCHFCGAEVPECGSVARNALADAAAAGSGRSVRADAKPAFADPERECVRAGVIRTMTCRARDVPVAREDGIEEQELTQLGLFGIKFKEVRGLKRPRKIVSMGGNASESHQEESEMKHLVLVGALCVSGTASAEIETARDLMDAGQYDAAMKELLLAARSGNAEAEELVGVMYASGLGVERDDVRAFEWYLRASMKGHPGAQSGIGWYYEVGRGLPAPDLVRAYTWYVLSTIGGDPDAAISQEEVLKKMTPEQIKKAHVLINDYRSWLYPFR